MKYRPLGKTGLQVSEIGYGGWGIGGPAGGGMAYGPTDDRESKRALRRAFDLGVNLFDTADLYGLGHGEELMGQELHDVRGQVLLATKAGFIDAAGKQDFSGPYLRSALECSLKRLRSEYVDVFHLHSPPIDILEKDDAVISTLEWLRREGKVRAIGISARNPEEALVAAERMKFDSIQVNFNLVDQRALDNGLLPLCEQRGIGVVIRTPLCFGFLTGGYSDPSAFDPTDHRSRWSPAQVQKWSDAYRLFVAALAGTKPQTNAQFALRFCLSAPGVSAAIPGMLSVAHVDDNTAASALGPLTDEEMSAVRRVYRENTFVVK